MRKHRCLSGRNIEYGRDTGDQMKYKEYAKIRNRVKKVVRKAKIKTEKTNCQTSQKTTPKHSGDMWTQRENPSSRQAIWNMRKMDARWWPPKTRRKQMSCQITSALCSQQRPLKAIILLQDGLKKIYSRLCAFQPQTNRRGRSEETAERHRFYKSSWTRRNAPIRITIMSWETRYVSH